MMGLNRSVVTFAQPTRRRVHPRGTRRPSERAYGAGDILAVCRATSVPTVFDIHHHVCYTGLTTYKDPMAMDYVMAARVTWLGPPWQLVQLSNGRERFADP